MCGNPVTRRPRPGLSHEGYDAVVEFAREPCVVFRFSGYQQIGAVHRSVTVHPPVALFCFGLNIQEARGALFSVARRGTFPMNDRALFDNPNFHDNEWLNRQGSKPGVQFGSLLMCDELADAPVNQ